MANSKGKPCIEESEVSKDYSKGSKCPWTANSPRLGAYPGEVHLLFLFLLFFLLTSMRHDTG